MTYFGETIRKAREAKGLTTSQIAEKTHILVQIINAMEREDFKPIKAAIYGRGFVKLICECLDLDPKPLVAEFMDIYQGRRPPVSNDAFLSRQTPAPSPVEPVRSAPSPVEPVRPEPAPAPDVAPAGPTLPGFTYTATANAEAAATGDIQPAVPEATESASPATAEATASEADESSMPGIIEAANVDMPVEPPRSAVDSMQENISPAVADAPQEEPAQSLTKGLDLFDPAPVTAETPPEIRAQDIFASTYAEPEESTSSGPSAADKFRRGLSVVSHGVLGSVRNIPRSAWRMAVLVVGALLVIGLLIWGCTILYRVTAQPADPAIQEAPPAAVSTEKPAQAKTQDAVQPAKPNAKKDAPSAKPGSKPTAKPVAKPAAKPVAKPAAGTAKPAAKPKLRSSGQKIPPLYVD